MRYISCLIMYGMVVNCHGDQISLDFIGFFIHDNLCTQCFRYNICNAWFLDNLNWKIFMHENIHVLNVCVNKFSRVPHENNLTRKFC